jgi:L-lactate dehydrogenase complex protein LldG
MASGPHRVLLFHDSPRNRRLTPVDEVKARQRVLAQVRHAIGGNRAEGEVAEEYAAIARDYLRAHHDPREHDIVALFAERTADYRAVVEQVTGADLAAAVGRVLAGQASAAGEPWFVVPGGLPADWLTGIGPTVRVAGDEPELSAQDLDGCAGVVTGCAAGIAETGTIVLDHGPGQGRRALTLVPDFHLVVVRSDQIAADLPEALARLDPARPTTFIAGPSATSDIELIRVEGVHGPRTLHVLIVSG